MCAWGWWGCKSERWNLIVGDDQLVVTSEAPTVVPCVNTDFTMDFPVVYMNSFKSCLRLTDLILWNETP